MALLAAFVTAVLAGSVTWTLFMAGLVLQGAFPFFISGMDLQDLAEMFLYSTLAGLVGSVPAAAINAILLAWLARRGRDAGWLAIASGGSLGFVIGGALATLVLAMNDGTLFWESNRILGVALSFSLPFTTAGALMGALHWRIAIRPRRAWRLFQERERATLRAME
ncbi:hypothetical protein [Dongia deserti]|uniref:hypothetical protein n=1 Tax=Dongia deserti TaxID=2268030 RepID=UPI0013C42BFC|nr:hypothetical protein [Dongia deserti]